jgi:hypothetical protein
MQSENNEFNASADIATVPLHNDLQCIAKLAVRRHIILKEGLTRRVGTAACTWLAQHRLREIVRKFDVAWHIRM